MVVYLRTPIWRCAVYSLVLLYLMLQVEAQNNEGQQSLGKVHEATAVFEEKDKNAQDKDLLKEKVRECGALLASIVSRCVLECRCEGWSRADEG